MKDRSLELAEKLDAHNQMVRRAAKVTKDQAKRLFGVTDEEISTEVRRIEEASKQTNGNGHGS